MFYRFSIDLNFHELPPADWLRRIREYAQANAYTVNPGQENEQRSYYLVQKCFHDEQPTKPCEPLDEWQSPD